VAHPAEWIAGRSQEVGEGLIEHFFTGCADVAYVRGAIPLGPSLLRSWAYQVFIRKSGLMRDIVKHGEFSRQAPAAEAAQSGLFSCTERRAVGHE
jgi:hypothetical protein